MVFLITFDLTVTFFIVFVVLLVIVYMAATIYFWGLTLNNVSGMNIVFALGISIDYSVHVAHKYLVLEVDDHDQLKTVQEKREIKA